MNHAKFALLASLSLTACVGSVPLADKPCPCTAGFACCESTNLCLAAGEYCPGSDGGWKTDGAGTSTTGAKNAIGRPCDISVEADPTQAVYNASASECPNHLCLKPLYDPMATGAPDTAGTCSAECTQDSDCDGELRDPSNPLDKRCASGFACGTPFVVGALSCKRLCMCKDFAGPLTSSTPIACHETTNINPIGSVAGVGQETEMYISIAPARKLDVVVMVDNSPSMAPKVGKLNASFPTLLDALKDSEYGTGTYPDLRVAIIDSDLGTGGAYSSGACGPKVISDGTNSLYGDLGRFQMLSSPTACSFNEGAQYLEFAKGMPVSFTGDFSKVFACLTSNLGTLGCGEEHQLQAFEFALAAKGIGNDQQQLMLRPEAYLDLIFLSAEDDCSAATHDGMFGDKPELRGESAGLRCATRAHTCGGTNLTTSPPGYPTSAAFSHAFSDCRARTDSCPNQTDGSLSGTDTSAPTNCSPLKDVHQLAQELKALKSDPAQVFVTGIFGWPREGDMATAQYKIAPVPNPNTADTQHPTVYDTWPVCYDSNHLPSAATMDVATGFDATAAAWGATGGLRESAFVDEFGSNGLKYSICEPDFDKPMASIGNTVARKIQNLCVDYQLVDTDSAAPGVQADCRVVYRYAATDFQGQAVTYTESAQSMPQCPAGATNGKVDRDCWQLTRDATKCPINGQLLQVLRTADEIAAGPIPEGTKIRMQCRTCPAAVSGSAVVPGCAY